MPMDFIYDKIIDLASREKLVEIYKEQREEIKRLENKIEEIQGWKNRSEGYEEYRIPETNAIVIRSKTNGNYYCSVCFEKNKMPIPLQPYGSISSCPNCKVNYKTRPYLEENLRQQDLQSYGSID